MPPLTACIITRDEEANLAACIASVRPVVQEVLVVDSGSTDRTVEIARALADRVVVRDWPGHVAQKQFAVDQAANRFVLCIDADERLTPELQASVRALMAGDADPPCAGYEVARRTLYLGRFLRRGGWYPGRKLRLFDRTRARWGGIDPHDRVVCDGAVGRLSGDLVHFTYRDLDHHVATLNGYTATAALEKRRRGAGAGAALLGMLLRPPARFLKMYLLRGGFLDGVAGLTAAVVASFYVFLKYAKLWEVARVGRPWPRPGEPER